MIDVMRNSRRAKTRFKEKAWKPVIHIVKKTGYFSDVTTTEKIINKPHSIKELWKKSIRSDEKVLE